jgi:DUF1009 family protein
VTGDSDFVGLIAGNNELPLLVARKAKETGKKLAVAGFAGEASPELSDLSDRYLELGVGELLPLADFFLGSGCEIVSLAGGVTRENILKNYRPDAEAERVMESLPDFNTNTVLLAMADWLEDRGLRFVCVTDLVPELLVKPGLLGKARPTPELLEDMRLAFKFAKELGRLDIGQTAVVSEKIALALEGADGTDATIRRGAALSRSPITAAKVFKPRQDPRVDLPVVGPLTLELLREVRAGALVLDAERLIILEPEKCVEIANDCGMVLAAWDGNRLSGEDTP